MCQSGLRLGQPGGHLHGAVQVGSGGQFGTDLLRPAELGVEGAEAAVTVGHQRSHPQLFGQREGLAVVALSPLGIWGLSVRGDLSEESEGPRMMASFVALTADC